MRQLAPSSASGSYSRPPSPFPSVPSSYLSHPPLQLHLYAALPCPWAHRTLIVRALRLPSLPLSLALPGVTTSWEFRPPSSDLAHSLPTLSHVYSLRPGGFSGRATVPMLWDPIRRDVVCNDSYAIIEFLNSVAPPDRDLAPPHLRDDIHRWNRLVYSSINNGVYRCGFAQSQAAYDIAVEELFAALDAIEANLAESRFLCGDELTLADVCLFTTLIRFDAVYNVLFRCTKRKLVEYPNLHGYTREIYQMPGVKETCDLDAIRDAYYGSLFH
ncbi:hypothetical protein HPP92_022076 [Vanilla planifolia]|uniref:GST C-terminal domain-containing protein n=1 Tax=Vanilla planifolia TaxID=51239 RepID=A0A835PNZ9_VANPL|nr:hypothetical protein HPP92_022076 [Vanilla planifolia]